MRYGMVEFVNMLVSHNVLGDDAAKATPRPRHDRSAMSCRGMIELHLASFRLHLIVKLIADKTPVFHDHFAPISPRKRIVREEENAL